ncbi:response regulator [Clostridium sp. AN503]|uniref:response regulator transcription factor n=1 Tax=Clostridium sp. AN503 TaxID=3160598 RepID=UPI00345B3013
MYRVMLVDDEPLILAGIASMLDWEQQDCRIVGKATNGQQALEQLDELKPDIIITDIKMPAMDGIEFMRRARENQCQAQFILLTNLEDFSLAREAVRLGALDYLVKLELDEEKLAETLDRAVEKCREKNPVGGVLSDRETQYGMTMADSIRNYFRRVLVFDLEGNAQEPLKQVIREQFQEPVLMLIHFNYGFEGFSPAFTRDDQKKMMGFAEDIITEMVKGFFDHSCLVRRDQNGFILVLSAFGIPDYQERIRKMGGKFLSVIKDYFEVSASVAVSRKGQGIEEFPELLYQVMSAMNYTYYEWAEPIVFYSEECEASNRHSSNFNISFLKKDLGQSIQSNDGEKFTGIMEQVEELLMEHKPSRAQAINGCSSLYYFITSFFEEQEESAFPYAVDIIGQLNRMGTLNDIIRWIGSFSGEVVKVLEQRADGKTDRNVELAQKYVEEHYREKISLAQLADQLGISQGYLSSSFKKQTGQNFTDYVNHFRVEKAKELIATHQYMMYEISDMLGFDTQYYFSTVFKKITGFTPKEYEALARTL